MELWDEVVKCYQLLSKPTRAELVVRERLKLGETPYMLTALGDLTQVYKYMDPSIKIQRDDKFTHLFIIPKDESCYERAWVLSGHRYARAKRTLAKICFDRLVCRIIELQLIELRYISNFLHSPFSFAPLTFSTPLLQRRNDFVNCREHLNSALSVQPMVAHAWYLKGIACLRMHVSDRKICMITLKFPIER